MMSTSYSWVYLTVFLSLLASSTPQFNSFRSRTRFQPTISPRFGLNSFGRQRGLNSFGRGVFSTTVDHQVTQTPTPGSSLEPDIETVASSTAPSTRSTRRSTTSATPTTPSSSAFGPPSSSSTETAGTPGDPEPGSRGASIVSGLGNSFTTAKTQTTTIPKTTFTTTTEAVPTTITSTRTTITASTTSARVTTPAGVFSNLFGRFNILATSEPVDITTVVATTTEITPPPSPSLKFSNLFGRTQSSPVQTTTRPLKLVTTEQVGGIESSSTKPVKVTTRRSTRRPSTTEGPATSSRSLFGGLRRLSTESPDTSSSAVTVKTSSRGSSIFSILTRPQATTTEAVSTTGPTITTTESSTTTLESVTTTTGVLANLLGRFNIFSTTTKDTVGLTTIAPTVAPPRKVSNVFGRPQSRVVTLPVITSTRQPSGEVGSGRREKEIVAGLSESEKSEETFPVMEPSEEMMNKVVDIMESLIFAGSVPASNKQSRKVSSITSSLASSTSQPEGKELPLVRGKLSLFGTRREGNSEVDEAGRTGKEGVGGEEVAKEEKDEAEAGDEKVGFGEVKESRKIGNLLTRLNLVGSKQAKVRSETSGNMSDDEQDEEKPVVETPKEIMDIVLESMEKLFLKQNQDSSILTRKHSSSPARSTTPSDPNSHRKPNSSFFSRNALKTKLRPLVAAVLSSPQSTTPLEDKVSMLRAVLSEELPPHIRDHILSSQFTQHARTLFRHQQTLAGPGITQSPPTSQPTTTRTTTTKETSTTVEATTATVATLTTDSAVTSQAVSRLKTTTAPTRRVQAVPDQISKQSPDEEKHVVGSPPRRIRKLFPTTTLVTPVDSSQSEVRVLPAAKPGSVESLPESSTEALPRRIVLFKAESDDQPPIENSRRTTTNTPQPRVSSTKLKAVRITTQPASSVSSATQEADIASTQPSVSSATQKADITSTQPSVSRAKVKAVKLLQQLVTTTKQPDTTQPTTQPTTLPTTLGLPTTQPTTLGLPTTQPSVSRAKVKVVKLLQQLVTNTKHPDTIRATTLPTRRVVQAETATPVTTPASKQSPLTPVTSSKLDFKQLKSLSTPAPIEINLTVNASVSPSDDAEAMLPPQLESESRRIVLLSRILSEASTISTTSVLTSTVSTTTVLPTASTPSNTRSQPGDSSPRRIVFLKALSDLVKSEVVGKTPTEKIKTKSPGVSGVEALPKLVKLAKAKSSESSSTLLGQSILSLSKVNKGASRSPGVELPPILSDTNQRTGKSLSRRIVLLKALSDDLSTSEGSKHTIQKNIEALRKVVSVTEKVSTSESIPDDAPSTNTPRRPVKPIPTVLSNLKPKAFKIHPAVPTPSTVTTKQPVKLSPKPSLPPPTTQPVPTLATSKPTISRVVVSKPISPTRRPVVKTTITPHSAPTPVPTSPTVLVSITTPRVKSTEEPTQSPTTRSPAQVPTRTLRVKFSEEPTKSPTTRSRVQVSTPSISLARRLPSVKGKEQELLKIKTVSESSSPAKQVIEIEVETNPKASAPTGGKRFFSRTPYREVASFHSLVEGGVELVTVGGRTLARSRSGERIPVRDSLPAGLTRTLKVTPVFITGVGRGRFF